MEELPEEFWLSVRHISSFKNRTEYNEYIEIEKNKYLNNLKK